MHSLVVGPRILMETSLRACLQRTVLFGLIEVGRLRLRVGGIIPWNKVLYCMKRICEGSIICKESHKIFFSKWFSVDWIFKFSTMGYSQEALDFQMEIFNRTTSTKGEEWPHFLFSISLPGGHGFLISKNEDEYLRGLDSRMLFTH